MKDFGFSTDLYGNCTSKFVVQYLAHGAGVVKEVYYRYQCRCENASFYAFVIETSIVQKVLLEKIHRDFQKT